MVGDTAAPIQSRSNRTSSILEGDQATLGGKIYGKENRFTCENCNETFASAFNLKNHIKRIHMKIKNVSCELCTYKGFSVSDIWTHKLYKHTTLKPFKCSLCPLAFKRACNLRVHIKRHDNHNGPKIFPCHVCGKMFKEKPSAKRCVQKHQSEGDFKCTEGGCDAEFKNGISFQSHMKRIHTVKDRVFMCDQCDKSFKIQSELKTHKYFKHEEREREFSCSVCPKKSISKHRLERHLLSHGSETLECPFDGCDKQSTNKYYINHHYKLKHGRVSYKKTLDERLEHEREKEEKVPCKVCKKLIKKGNKPTTSMKIHLRRHENQTPYVCSFDECSDEIYYTQSSTHHGFNVPKEYFEHLEEKHQVNMKTHIASVNFNCKLCGENFTLESANAEDGVKFWSKNSIAWASILSKHISKDHLKNLDIKKDWKLYYENSQVAVKVRETIVDKEFELRKILSCLKCKLCTFSSKSKSTGERIKCLVEHYCRDHFTEPMQDSVKQHISDNYCKACDKTFQFNNTRRLVHVSLHHAELYPFLKEDSEVDLEPFIVKKVVVKEKLNYKCEECGKDFSNKTGMKAHLVYHSDKRPFPCKKCNKAFKTKRDLTMHDTSHTGEKTFNCTLCKKTFSQSANLYTHTKRLHETKEVKECHDCRKEFQTRFDFLTHLPLRAEIRFRRLRKENQSQIGCKSG